MLRTLAFTLQLLLGASLLLQVPAPDAIGCKPCADPTLAGLLDKADIVAIAEVRKVDVKTRPPEAQQPRELRDVRWKVKVVRGLKGSPPAEITVEHADAPPCITALVPQPGRYLMLLYYRDGRYSPLAYCDRALFPIDAQDRVTLAPAMLKELRLTSAQAPLQSVAELLDRLAVPPPT
jgi:hypothetical protein